VWLGNCPLKVVFPSIYECCEQQDWTVADVDGLANLSFSSTFFLRQVQEWEEFTTSLPSGTLNGSEDVVKLDLEKMVKFEVNNSTISLLILV
jgi:hypothetical protein